MGTPLFAVPLLAALCETEDVLLVVTQPDRPSGRGRKLKASPVKEEALRRGIPLLQPERAGDPDTLASLREVGCDLIVVAAYGQILPKEILKMPPHGCMNIHASLLPKYRGASPIVEAIIHGETRTGVTIMGIDEGRDTGDILLQKGLDILEEETAGMLSERLSSLGVLAIREALEALREGRLTRTRQNHSQATYFPRLKKEQGEIDWNREPGEIRNHVRGMDPWPGAFTYVHGKVLKIWRVTPREQTGKPGTVLSAGDRLIVAVKGGSVSIEELQVPGRNRVRCPEFLRGHHEIREGMVLGRE